jgi:hypothetical protein
VLILLVAIHFSKLVRAVVADSFVEKAAPDQFHDHVIGFVENPRPGLIEF